MVGGPGARTEPDVDLFLEVEDTGIGIPKDQHDRIFGSFSQVSGQSTRKFGGTGLGLAITKRLIEMMQGTVTVESEPGKGSVFRFRFPNVAVAQMAEPGQPGDSTAGGDLNQFAPATILVADDVQLNRQLVAGFLEGTPHTLIQATHGREAVELIRELRPDVILMDMRMPELDGYSATAQVKADPALKHIPVIAVTASSFREEEARARRICDGYLRKPFSQAELVGELKRFLKPVASRAPDIAAPELESRPAESPESVSAEAVARRPEILAQLREQRETVWPRLCQTMDMGEIEGFAQRLSAWAGAGGWPDLRSYAASLQQQVETFDVDRLPRTLEEFPAICERIAGAG